MIKDRMQEWQRIQGLRSKDAKINNLLMYASQGDVIIGHQQAELEELRELVLLQRAAMREQRILMEKMAGMQPGLNVN